MDKVDLVIAYVDNKDPIWRNTYMDYCIRNNIRMKIVELKTQRFEDIGLVNYQLKLVNKHMPFVNQIFLLLSNKEQAPKDLPNNVKIVLHKEFIPNKFLPTFNSTTIEMFLWNIPNLNEHFIYSNDDMLPFKDLEPSDFYGDYGKIKIKFYEEDLWNLHTQFRCQCFNSYQHIAKALGLPTHEHMYLRPQHSMCAMIKSHCEQAYKLIQNQIDSQISAFRTEYQHNQYIYPIYEHLKYGTLPCEIDFLYTQFDDGIDLDHQIVCLNKIPEGKEKTIIKELEQRL